MSDVFAQPALSISGMLFASVWEGALVVAAVWLFLRSFSRLGASTRYAIWLCVLVMLVVAPVCTVAFSTQHASQPASISASSPAGRANAAAATQTFTVPVRPAHAAQSGDVAATPSIAPAPARRHINIPLDLSLAIAALWVLAAAIRFAVLAAHLRRLAILRRSAQNVRTAFGYPVLESSRATVPLAIGFVKPAVVLPAALHGELSTEAIDAIVMHEVAHLQRNDVWTNALARVLEILLAVNPFAWFVLVRLSVEREIACDDWVVARLDAGEVFANALAKIVCRPAYASLAAPSAIGSKHAVVDRIERLLDRRARRLRLSPVALTSVLLSLAVFAGVVPGVSPVIALAAQPSALASAGCSDHPPLAPVLDKNMRPTNAWKPIGFDAKKASDPRNTVVDLTIDANGKPGNVVVVSSPHARDAAAAKWFLAHQTYRPAVAHCKAVAATVRIAGLIDIAPPAPISIVRADYPNGWSNAHPGACRIPDLLHGGVPGVALVNNKQLTTSVSLRVDANGKVVDAALVHPSGNAAYDNAVLAAARGQAYPLDESTGFKPVRPSGAALAWNATHGYSAYSKCAPRPAEYTWTTTFPPADNN